MARTLLIAFTMSVVGMAQSATLPSGTIPPMFKAAYTDVTPAEQPGAWVIHVMTRGGFTGGGTGDLVVTSEGQRMLPESAKTTWWLPLYVLKPLSERIRATEPSHWTPSRLSTCADCVVTLLVLARRDSNGAVQTLSAFWDTTTHRSVAAEVMRIYDAALRLK